MWITNLKKLTKMHPDYHIWMDFWHGASSWERHLHLWLFIIHVNRVWVLSVNLYLHWSDERLSALKSFPPLYETVADVTNICNASTGRLSVWDWLYIWSISTWALVTWVPGFTCTPCGYRGTEYFRSESCGFSAWDPQATPWSWKQESLEWSVKTVGESVFENTVIKNWGHDLESNLQCGWERGAKFLLLRFKKTDTPIFLTLQIIRVPYHKVPKNTMGLPQGFGHAM